MENKRLFSACNNSIDKFITKLSDGNNEFGYEVAYKTIYGKNKTESGNNSSYVKKLYDILSKYELLNKKELPDDVLNALVYYRILVRFNTAAKQKNITKKENGGTIKLSYDSEFDEAFKQMNNAWLANSDKIKFVDDNGREYAVDEFFSGKQEDGSVENLSESFLAGVATFVVSTVIEYAVEKVAVSCIKSSPAACSWVREQCEKHPTIAGIVDFFTWTDIDEITKQDKINKGEQVDEDEDYDEDGYDSGEYDGENEDDDEYEAGYYFDEQTGEYYYYNGDGSNMEGDNEEDESSEGEVGDYITFDGNGDIYDEEE